MSPRFAQAHFQVLKAVFASHTGLPSADKGQYACQRLKSTLASSSSLAGVSPPASSSSPAPIFSRWRVLRSFLGADLVAGKADEAAGLAPGNEDNAVSCQRCPKKPCCLLSAEGKIAETGEGVPLPHPCMRLTYGYPAWRSEHDNARCPSSAGSPAGGGAYRPSAEGHGWSACPGG